MFEERTFAYHWQERVVLEIQLYNLQFLNHLLVFQEYLDVLTSMASVKLVPSKNYSPENSSPQKTGPLKNNTKY